MIVKTPNSMRRLESPNLGAVGYRARFVYLP